MEVHSDDQCQKHWREIFASQIEEAIYFHVPQETDQEIERIRWFVEGLRYAAMIIRWDETQA